MTDEEIMRFCDLRVELGLARRDLHAAHQALRSMGAEVHQEDDPLHGRMYTIVIKDQD